ncbi:Clan SB, family S8 [Tritrichomonas foetus]|uniref:Clan SB, family S8 n=1 Tax=Tritrichomonas foetus TaxID=1144522 RepID=A0A1J4KF64_9EUKA|nr:Clan SB, family S8 [Tritrichomonas foetus]|eukprot:OHT08238.1 Clan SB, family S8 [Tritrichomonas foetus]
MPLCPVPSGYSLSHILPTNTLLNSGHPISSGWFLIQILSLLSTNQVKFYQSNYNLSFDTRYQIYTGCFEQYLNKNQYNFLSKDKNFLLTPIPKTGYANSYQHLFESNKEDPFKKASESASEKCLIQATQNWKPADPKIYFKKKSYSLFVANVSCSHFATDDRIKITLPYKGKKLNNRYLTGFLQTGSEEGVFENGSYVSPHPFYDLGIRGERQIIAVSDTGVDTLHNFFYDPQHEVVINKTLENHRKIHAYYSCADSTDVRNGHGTHVSGIALGEALDKDSGIALYNGVAPKAKLFFFDIGYSHDTSGLSGVYDEEEICNIMDREGVKINSNSWGYSPDFTTLYTTAEYDKFAYDHPEMLFVFAAGNAGGSSLHSNLFYFSIDSPSDSKNVLSIGSTNSTKLSEIDYRRNWKLVIDDKNEYDVTCETYSLNLWAATLDNPIRKFYQKPIKFYKESDANYDGSIVFVQDATCDLLTSIANKKASAIVISTVIDICPSYINIPVLYISTLPQEGTYATFVPTLLYPQMNNRMSRAWYSSVGPTITGRTKPDIVVPGQYIVSSAAGDPNDKNPRPATTNTLVSEMGTSMATPAAAGLASLLRQYFLDGFYPTRKASTKDSIQNISSSLIRAALVNSASPLNEAGFHSFSGPNILTGFGIPNMSTLFLKPLRIIPNGNLKPNEKHVYPLNIQHKNESIRVTMGYLDPPLSGLSITPLYADLDLHIVSPSGKLYTGNGYSNNRTEMMNTIERIIIPVNEVETGQYKIIVTANSYSDDFVDSINYSLVVNGPFDHFDYKTNPIYIPLYDSKQQCETTCLYGKCVNGRCVCDKLYHGFDCSSQIQEFELQKQYKLDLDPSDIKYFQIPLGFYDVNDQPTIAISSATSGTYFQFFFADFGFTSLSEPGIISAIGSGGGRIYYHPIALNGTDEYFRNLVLYFAVKVHSPTPDTVTFTLSVNNPRETPTPAMTNNYTPSESKIPTPSESQIYIPSESKISPQATSDSSEIKTTQEIETMVTKESNSSVDNNQKNESNQKSGLVITMFSMIIVFSAILVMVLVGFVIVIAFRKRRAPINDEKKNMDISYQDAML